MKEISLVGFQITSTTEKSRGHYGVRAKSGKKLKWQGLPSLQRFQREG